MGFMELTLILIIVLIIFGAGRLPQLGEGLGKAIKGFKKSVHEAEAFDVEPQDQGGAQPAGATAVQPTQLPEPTVATAPQAHMEQVTQDPQAAPVEPVSKA